MSFNLSLCALVGNCTVVEMRSLIQARDDSIAGTCAICFVDVYFAKEVQK